MTVLIQLAYNSNGQLALSIPETSAADCFRQSWIDHENDPLEAHLRQIVCMVILAGEIQYREAEQHDYDSNLARHARKRATAESEEVERNEPLVPAGRESLLELTRDWRLARDVRDFIQALRDAGERGDQFERWASWALGEADAIDPTASSHRLRRALSPISDKS